MTKSPLKAKETQIERKNRTNEMQFLALHISPAYPPTKTRSIFARILLYSQADRITMVEFGPKSHDAGKEALLLSRSQCIVDASANDACESYVYEAIRVVPLRHLLSAYSDDRPKAKDGMSRSVQHISASNREHPHRGRGRGRRNNSKLARKSWPKSFPPVGEGA